MSCQTVRRSISEFLDRRLPGPERARVADHLASCPECAAHRDDLAANRSAMLGLPNVPVPTHLQVRLQVLASHERSRWNSIGTLPAAMRTAAENLRLAADNLLRPVALPFAGGLLSALLLFGIVVPTFGFRPIVRNDVPIQLYTSATLVDAASFGMSSDGTVVSLAIDDKGQAMDYSVVRGTISPELQSDIAKMMVFARFSPASIN